LRKKYFISFFIPLILALVVVLIFIFKDPFHGQDEILIEYSDTLQDMPVIIREYGLAIDSFIIHSGRIKRNQNLSSILLNHGVSSRTINEMVNASEGIFNLRKVRYGNPYKIFCSKDTLEKVQYFVYEHTPVEFFMIDLTDSVRVLKQDKELKEVTREVSGKIHSSLWVSMLENKLDPMLAIELSEIYAWNIDFFNLQQGDMYKVIFNEHYVDSQYVGLGKIHATWFYHSGNDFYAIPFIQDSIESYFDQEGNSLRRAFLKSPVRFSRISSRYSHSRLHPILKIRRPHYGVDYAAPVGTPVYAIGDGKVIETSYKPEAGNMVRIRHNSVYTTAYLHLRNYAKGIRVGKTVRQGDVIGYVGNTGLSTGPHLDFRFYKNGYPIDPLKVEAPPVEPVREENRIAYDSVRSIITSRLDRIQLADTTGVLPAGSD
jgi:murein DD-endopeptidase MepM/ murein hydrolase activator NlpD